MTEQEKINPPMRRIEAILVQNRDNGELLITGNDSLGYEALETHWRDCSHHVLARIPVDVLESVLQVPELPAVVVSKKIA